MLCELQTNNNNMLKVLTCTVTAGNGFSFKGFDISCMLFELQTGNSNVLDVFDMCCAVT